MKTIRLLLFALLLIPVSCDEIIDEDISNAQVEIISPLDNLTTTRTTLTFWWNELDEADKYQLQIVSPSFDTVLSIPLDTNITTNKFEVTLNPGKYNWRVRAKNSSYSTAWFTRKLIIDDVPDLTDQEVLLKSPKEQDVVGNGKIKFQWTKLPNATNYMLIVKINTWEGSLAIPSEVTVNDTLTKVLDEGKYVWGVRGLNENSQSKTQSKTFFVDLTAPEKPTLTSPANNSTITGTTTPLQWQHTSTDLTTVYDSLYVSKENNFTQANIMVAEKLTATTYTFNTTTKGKYYWKVRTIDKANNKSEYSTIFNFTLE